MCRQTVRIRFECGTSSGESEYGLRNDPDEHYCAVVILLSSLEIRVCTSCSGRRGAVPCAFSICDLLDVLRSAVDTIGEIAASKQIDLDCVGTNQSLMVEADVSRLQQVWRSCRAAAGSARSDFLVRQQPTFECVRVRWLPRADYCYKREMVSRTRNQHISTEHLNRFARYEIELTRAESRHFDACTECAGALRAAVRTFVASVRLEGRRFSDRQDRIVSGFR